MKTLEKATVGQTALIADQNDQFRKTWSADFTVPGQIVYTSGVADLPPSAHVSIMQAFDTFTEEVESRWCALPHC